MRMLRCNEVAGVWRAPSILVSLIYLFFILPDSERVSSVVRLLFPIYFVVTVFHLLLDFTNSLNIFYLLFMIVYLSSIIKLSLLR